jgi:subtilase family serine protease
MEGGVTFVSASGDNGEPASWPATSTHVVAVGGTTLNLGRKSKYRGESAWSGSGGGVSIYQGTYAPDVAYDADPNSGFSVYDSYEGNGGWQTVGGTSAGCPQWAALIAIVDQGRELSGLSSLDGPSETLSGLYAISHKAFHDITTGANSNYAAKVGYDLVTGRGSPVASRLIPSLVAYQGSGSASAASVQRELITSPSLSSTTMITSSRHRDLASLFGTTEIL